ncbi:MAG: hypothetical protein ACYTFQ_23970 [Planctomycetota bacterium]
MAHQHLHLHDDIHAGHTHGKQVRVSLALLGTLANTCTFMTIFMPDTRTASRFA